MAVDDSLGPRTGDFAEHSTIGFPGVAYTIRRVGRDSRSRARVRAVCTSWMAGSLHALAGQADSPTFRGDKGYAVQVLMDALTIAVDGSRIATVGRCIRVPSENMGGPVPQPFRLRYRSMIQHTVVER